MDYNKSEVLNLERVLALEAWVKATNTKLVQVNGQRKYGGPPEAWVGPPPKAHCEVFISQIPRDAYEDLLIPLFSTVGPLWEFRLMMNFSGQNRGFAYAKYGSPGKVTEAVQLLHGHVLEPGSCLSVRRSIEKRHVCIGDLPATTRREDLLKVLHSMTEGVEGLSLKAGLGIEGVTAIVSFSSHHAASMAKRALVEAFKRQFSLNISIRWHSADKPSPGEQRSKSQLPSAVEPPQPILTSPQHSVLPPRRASPPSTTPGFCRVVGGPATNRQPPSPSSSTSYASFLQQLASAVSSSCPEMLLCKLCEMIGVGQPLYEMHYSHTGADGILYFTYEVCIPGIIRAFKGLVTILPRPTASTTLEEAKWAAAQQVLQRLYNNQFTP